MKSNKNRKEFAGNNSGAYKQAKDDLEARKVKKTERKSDENTKKANKEPETKTIDDGIYWSDAWPWLVKESKNFILNIKKKSKALLKNNKKFKKKDIVTFIEKRETDKNIFKELTIKGDEFTLVREGESITFKNRLTGKIEPKEGENLILDEEKNINNIDSESSDQTLEEVEGNFSFLNDLVPPSNVSLYGQEKELIIKLNDGRQGLKRWKWYPDESLDEGGEWDSIGSPGDGSVYINEEIGSLFNLEEIKNKSTSLQDVPDQNLKEVEKNIDFKVSQNSYNELIKSKLGDDINEKELIKKYISESYNSDKTEKESNNQIEINDSESSDQTLKEGDEDLSLQESPYLDKNEEKIIINNHINQINQIDDNSSIISIIIFNANKEKYRFKESLFSKKLNIGINQLSLTIKTYNTLRRNDINFLYQLPQFSKNDLLNLRNLGVKACEELISSILNFHNIYDDSKNLNENFQISYKKDSHIDKLNTNSNVSNILRRNGIEDISDLTKFSEDEIKNFNGFGSISWANLKKSIKTYEEINSTKIKFKNLNNSNHQIKFDDNTNSGSIEFWNFIQAKFQNIKTQTNNSDIENIDNLLESFFQEAYKNNSNLRTLEMIYLISDEECKKFNESSIKKLTFEYQLYKYLIFKKFLNSENTFSALSWISKFSKVIERDNSIVIYLQRISGKTLAEIGRERNLSRERIRQIELKISKLTGTSASELTKISRNLKEEILFKEESSIFSGIIKKFGRLPHKLDKLKNENVSDSINNYLKLNLKERIDIYEKFYFEIPSSEYDFHYEYVSNLNGIVGNGYWLKLENLKEYLFRHANKLGEPDLMPKQTSLPRAVGGVVQRHGGQSKVAALVGLKYQGQLVNPDGGRSYWTDQRLEDLIDDVNKFYIQDLSIMPERTQFVNFFKSTTIKEYQDKKVYSAFAAFTKQEVLSWEEVAIRFRRKTFY